MGFYNQSQAVHHQECEGQLHIIYYIIQKRILSDGKCWDGYQHTFYIFSPIVIQEVGSLMNQPVFWIGIWPCSVGCKSKTLYMRLVDLDWSGWLLLSICL